jgi:hypothetical protein
MTRRRRTKLNHRRGGVQTGRGAVQIEFILSFLVIMFVMFAMWELIMIVHTMNVLSDAAKEGVRCAIVSGNGCPAPPGCPYGADNIRCRVWDYARFSFHDISAINIPAPSYLDGSDDPPNRVRVTVEYDFIPFTALPFRPRLRGASEGRIVYKP